VRLFEGEGEVMNVVPLWNTKYSEDIAEMLLDKFVGCLESW